MVTVIGGGEVTGHDLARAHAGTSSGFTMKFGWPWMRSLCSLLIQIVWL